MREWADFTVQEAGVEQCLEHDRYAADPVDVDPARVRGHVRIDDVTFRHPGSDVPAVAGVTLDVPAGSTLALAGETGSGKSTLAALVAVLVGSTLSKDGTIGDVYRTSWRLAAQTYARGANTAARSARTEELRKVTEAIIGEEEK